MRRSTEKPDPNEFFVAWQTVALAELEPVGILRRGQRYRGDHPLVEARREFFIRGWRESGAKDAPEASGVGRRSEELSPLMAAEGINVDPTKLTDVVMRLVREHSDPELVATLISRGESFAMCPTPEWTWFQLGDLDLGRIPSEQIEMR